MRMQVEPVAEAVMMEVEDQATATGTAPLVASVREHVRREYSRASGPPNMALGGR